MWLSDLFQDNVPLLCYAIAVRRPVLIVGFIEASTLRRLACLPPHRNLIEITPGWFDSQGEKTAQLHLLFQGETANITAPRLTLVASNIPTRLLPNFFNLPKAWLVSTLNRPNSLPEDVITFNLRTKTFLNVEEGQLASSYLLSQLQGVAPQEWELMLQSSLRLIAAKAQNLAYLTEKGVEAEYALRLLGIKTHSELDLCVSLAKADYPLNLEVFHTQACKELEKRGKLESEGTNELRQEFEQLRRSMIHIDDVRTMLASITESLVNRGVPPDLLTRVLSGALREWIPESRL